MAAENENITLTTPAYVPYATLISSLDALRNHGIPASGKIDKSIWESQSGSIRGQLILSYRFFGLIDPQNRVLPSLQALVNAVDRKPLLRKIIEEKYRDVIALDLTTISPGQLTEAFEAFGISGSTLKTAMRFFIKACTELGIPIAKRFSDRTRSTGPRKKRSANGSRRGDVTPPSDLTTPQHHVKGTWEEQLLGKFPTFDPSWTDDLKAKWFEGFGRLMGAKPGA
ncbi:MAG: hypothetical protein ABSB15_22620 [Bryobacteraceae bacterium]|jgi:hypothetical protein